jgi:hypothetical protein
VWTRKESFQTQQRRAGHPLCSLKYRQEAQNRSSWSLTCFSSAKTYSRSPPLYTPVLFPTSPRPRGPSAV